MNEMAFPRKIDAPPQSSCPPAENLPTYDARDLIPDGAQARVLLDNQCYYLRITRAGKLILTK